MSRLPVFVSMVMMLAACGAGSASPDAEPPAPDTSVADARPDAVLADARPDASPDAMPDAFFDNGTTSFTATKEGDPKWQTAGWEIFSAQNTVSTGEALWLNHGWNQQYLSIEPAVVHPPPYDDEPTASLAMYGWDSGDDFYQSKWTYPLGLMIAAVIVPTADAPVGKTTDYDSGLMIPDADQLYVDGDLYQGDTLVDAGFDSAYPKLSQLLPGTAAQGWSHMTLTWGEDTRFIPGTPGTYTLKVHLYEIATPTNGWRIEVPFTVR